MDFVLSVGTMELSTHLGHSISTETTCTNRTDEGEEWCNYHLLVTKNITWEEFERRQKKQMKTKEEFEAQWPSLMDDVPCGFWCPKGWTDRVWRLLEDIDEVLDGEIEVGDFKITQVKEKFGGLRFYYSYPIKGADQDKINELVNQAESDCWNLPNMQYSPGCNY
jgi:hypothetical protein